MHVLADVGLHEYEDEYEHGRHDGDERYPRFDGKLEPAGRYEPPASLRVGRRQAVGHFEFFGVRGRVEIVGGHHRYDGYGNAEIAQSSANLKSPSVRYCLFPRIYSGKQESKTQRPTVPTYTSSEEFTVSEMPKVVGDKKRAQR